MDMITLAMAKNYTNSQRLGYVEGGEVLTFDGDTTGKTVVDFNNLQYVKISDKPHDLTKLEKVVMSVDPEMAEAEGVPADQEVPKEEYIIEHGDAYDIVTVGNLFAVLSYRKKFDGVVFDVGVYVVYMGMGWVSRLEFAETIHPIDPKYLPDTVATKADILGAMEASY